MQGKEYNYQLDNNETYDKYVYKDAIPLKDYNEGSISLTCDKEVLIDSIAVENYLAQIMDRFIYISMFTEEKGGYIYSNMGKLTYQFRDFWNNNEIDIKGTIQGNAHITIKGENNNICYFDKTIPIGTNQVFDLKEPLQHLQVIDFMCVFQIDGTEYKINHSIKIIEGSYTYKDNRFMNFIKEGDF